VEPTAIATFEVAREDARAYLRDEIGHGLTDVISAVSGQQPDPRVVEATLQEVEEDVRRIGQMSSEEVAASAASSLRALADTIEAGGRDTDPGALGQRIDVLIERLEREVGPHMGQDPEREQQQREAEYLDSARSA